MNLKLLVNTWFKDNVSDLWSLNQKVLKISVLRPLIFLGLLFPWSKADNLRSMTYDLWPFLPWLCEVELYFELKTIWIMILKPIYGPWPMTHNPWPMTYDLWHLLTLLGEVQISFKININTMIHDQKKNKFVYNMIEK